MTEKTVQRRHKLNRYSRAAIAGDAVGLTHFILANLALAVGQATDLFAFADLKHGGIHFIYNYLDAPVYALLKSNLGNIASDTFHMFLAVESVIVTASILYGLVVYLFFKVLGSLFG